MTMFSHTDHTDQPILIVVTLHKHFTVWKRRYARESMLTRNFATCPTCSFMLFYESLYVFIKNDICMVLLNIFGRKHLQTVERYTTLATACDRKAQSRRDNIFSDYPL